MAKAETIGIRIKTKRLRAGLTQTELATKIGVTQAALSNWERGSIVPDQQQVEKLGRIIGRINLPGQREGEVTAAATDAEESGHDAGPSAFGAWLNRERIQAALSVSQLAELAGVAAPTIYGIESGRIGNPRDSTQAAISRAIGKPIPQEVSDELKDQASIEGIGELVDFDPNTESDIPTEAGVYVLYDITERPVYVGQASNIRRRMREHSDKFWFKAPIVENAAFVAIPDQQGRDRIEKLLIKFLKSNALLNIKNVSR
jgi:transcriptional regulator with XRE-family HTH domain